MGAAPSITGIATHALGQVTVDWVGRTEAYLVETTSALALGSWIEATPTTPNQTLTLIPAPGQAFCRIRSSGVAP